VTRESTRGLLRVLGAVGLVGLVVGVLAVRASGGDEPSTLAVRDASASVRSADLLTRSLPAGAAPLRVVPPLGYDTVAARDARAAAQAAADAAVQAAAEAATAADAEAEAEASARQAAARPTPARTAGTPSSVPQPPGLPLGVNPGNSDQVVTVVATRSGATTATLTAWQRGPGGWAVALGPVSARIGSAGVGSASETSTRTPAGTFTLTEAFGRAGNPGTALPYRVVDGDDWWVSDVHSPRYNRYAECARGTCDFAEAASENLFDEPAYERAVVIDYNRSGTPGAGSAFFLHVSNGAPTAGCVAVDAGSLTALLRWLDPAARPVIAIGVG
jgi:L,D-peptidoglycan transpeptidase YkuD (ErfK/YbiS/YcfS/YnhG family)